MRCLLLAVAVGTHLPHGAVALRLFTNDPPKEIPMPADSIYPHIRQKGCGHKNLEVPQLLKHAGKGQYVVDVGLGNTAGETFEAVRNGFTVLGFEPMPGNIAHIKRIVENSPDLKGKVYFVHPAKDENGKYAFPKIERPTAQSGFAYIFHAGLSDSESTAHLPGYQSLTNSIRDNGASGTPVAVTTLDKVLPDWIKAGVHMLKIDTQGWELQILRGASRSLENGLFKYVQYEFSPWLMKWAGADKVGRPEDLIVLLPSMGGMCFDMMGEHHRLSRPSSPVKAYFESIDSTRNSPYKGHHGDPQHPYEEDGIGPWDDIMCYMPGLEESVEDGSSVEHVIEQVLKDVCVHQS
jgi:FkbM family methyltransferase